MTEQPLRVSRIRISDILGIEELDYDAGQFNLVEAMNGQGKSSFLEAMKSIIGDTDQATLLRNGADSGEVVFVLSDGSEFRRRVSATGRPTLTAKDGAGTKIDSPSAHLRALLDPWTTNPVEFLTARKQDRVTVLLESLPMIADADRLAKIVGGAIKIPEGQHALTTIQQQYDAVFAERTGTKKARSEKEATINQLTATLPEGEIASSEDQHILQAQVDTLDKAKDEHGDAIRAQLDREKKEVDAQVDALQVEIDNLRSLIQGKRDAFAERERAAATARANYLEKYSAERAPVVAKLSALRMAADAVSKAEATRSTITTMRGQLEALDGDVERQDEMLKALLAYKSELLSQLPVPGLEVRDGEVYLNDVPFDRVNKAAQVKIAVEIAKLRAGKLGIILVDELESLDPETFAAFKAEALATDLQLFVTRVSNTPLTVTHA